MRRRGKDEEEEEERGVREYVKMKLRIPVCLQLTGKPLY